MAVVRLGNDWDGVIGDQFRQDYYLKLRQFLLEEYRTRIIYPDKWGIFTCPPPKRSAPVSKAAASRSRNSRR